MKFISIVLISGILLVGQTVNAKNADSSVFKVASERIKVGDFSYQDLTQVDSDGLGHTQLNHDEFEFFLKQALSMQSGLKIVDDGFADKTIVGRVTKINSAGDARVELGFSRQGHISLAIDDVPDMVALEVKLDLTDSAMISLVDQVKHMIILSLAPESV